MKHNKKICMFCGDGKTWSPDSLGFARFKPDDGPWRGKIKEIRQWATDNNVNVCMKCADNITQQIETREGERETGWYQLLVYVKSIYEDPDILYSL